MVRGRSVQASVGWNKGMEALFGHWVKRGQEHWDEEWHNPGVDWVCHMEYRDSV